MIEASGLRESFKGRGKRKALGVDAVRGADFAVSKGEIFGFLGPIVDLAASETESRRPSLDDVFLAKTGRTLAD